MERIESHLAHLERQFEELNAVVIEQGRHLKRVQALQKRMGLAIESVEAERIRQTNPKPPHYQ